MEAGTAKCSSCGYSFTGIAANSSSERLAQQLQALEKQYGNKEKSAGRKGEGNDDRRISSARTTIISSFSVPPTKDDLLEFAVTMRSKWLNTQGVVYRQEKNAYKAKYNECMEKFKIFFPGDKTFASILGVVLATGTLSLVYMGINAMLANVFHVAGFNLADYAPDSLMISVNAITNILVINALIVAVAFIALFVSLTYVAFKKRDVK